MRTATQIRHLEGGDAHGDDERLLGEAPQEGGHLEVAPEVGPVHGVDVVSTPAQLTKGAEGVAVSYAGQLQRVLQLATACSSEPGLSFLNYILAAVLGIQSGSLPDN